MGTEGLNVQINLATAAFAVPAAEVENEFKQIKDPQDTIPWCRNQFYFCSLNSC